ncbi:VOC family protein [Pseudooceanicola nanhaiensis]|uniref:VOC family protein n=1 Tax=Pseudooceanicola nanhaiensis TaxID=375761 RepID=UPI001CD21D31|nr:VOC family protein [Pseudooceanicola nanhaiensis]MCA0922326.1 VOC family protein [Pseudooceanicola nanhaiensis]
MSTASAPLEIGRVTLTVRDLKKVGRFYADVLGLERLSGDGEQALYGVGDAVLLDLRQDKAAKPNSPREAGLFHTAFLLPQRADLGAWVQYVVEKRFPVQGTADHLVSEAIYLGDPEGNGVEIYIDRPRSQWILNGGEVEMSTDPLDVQSLASSARKRWSGAPQGTVVGHVHLQTGTLAEAESFYAGTLGFPVSSHYPGALFYGSGGYHHHLATNIWNSRGAKTRTEGMAGLSGVEILGTPSEIAGIRTRAGAKAEAGITDPWGLTFTLTEKKEG